MLMNLKFNYQFTFHLSNILLGTLKFKIAYTFKFLNINVVWFIFKIKTKVY